MKKVMMLLNDESLKIIITIIGTFATSLLTVGKYFKNNLKEFHDQIIILRGMVNELDKKLAVQTALFQNFIGRDYDRDHRNQKDDRLFK